MAKVEPPLFVLPKKRNGKKSNNNTGHVDHIITVQGSGEDTLVKFKNGLSPVTEHDSGTIQPSLETLKSSLKIDLSNNGEDILHETDCIEKVHIEKNGYQALSTNGNRELIDLSPIYENSSDACSSHGDLQETEVMYKSNKILCNEINEISSSSLSQTQSDNSIEMGDISDSPKSAQQKKNMNIVTYNNINTEITAFKIESECSPFTGNYSLTNNSKESYLTMTGTIKRMKKGQQIDVKLNISQEELEFIEAAIVAEEYEQMDFSKCALRNGPHIFIFTMMCLPFVALVSVVYSSYIGTLAWYNIFLKLTDKLSWKTVLLLPIIVVLYPFLIVILNIGIGLYAGIAQLTFSSVTWRMGVFDFEKGFYGWLCNAINMSDCSPYGVVVLMDVKS